MSTDETSIEWSELDRVIAAMYRPKTAEARSPSHVNQKPKDNTYIIFSPGNPTLFLNSLDPILATESERTLLDRHLTGVKTAKHAGPMWPNPAVLTMGMQSASNTISRTSTMPSTSAAAAAAAAANISISAKVVPSSRKGRISRMPHATPSTIPNKLRRKRTVKHKPEQNNVIAQLALTFADPSRQTRTKESMKKKNLNLVKYPK
ncbi:uncharacterized protein LOC115627553 [Scaptodrosophila lebanonensis]|uniref:Uncharacterized protein LOC115627553 n=1 Tax=Drosophila lebanonensis TaxID=7225 RepID=A0A6J2TR39_DROLE|nr:uncharacterized protein LOC115627553 [Scaptodrosophila lebanonensis]